MQANPRQPVYSPRPFGSLGAPIVVSLAGIFAFTTLKTGFLGLPLSLVPCLVSPVLLAGFALCVVVAIPSLNWNLASSALAGLALAIISLSVSHLVSDWQKRESIRAATPLVSAIHRFRADMGAYPAALRELVPFYIDSIPTSRMGTGDLPFLYSPSPEKFGLAFRVPGELSLCRYESPTREWTVSEPSPTFSIPRFIGILEK